MKKMVFLLFLFFALGTLYAQSSIINKDHRVDTIVEGKEYIDWTEHRYIIITDEFSSKVDVDSKNEKAALLEKCKEDARKKLINLIKNTQVGSNTKFKEKKDKEAKEFFENLTSFVISANTNYDNNVLKMNCEAYSYMGIEDLIKEKNKYLFNEFLKIMSIQINKAKEEKIVKINDKNYKIKVYATKDDTGFSFEKQEKVDKEYINYEINSEKQITGLIIDTRGFNVDCSLCPRVRLSNGELVFSPSLLSNLDVVTESISNVTFIKDESNANQGDNPLKIYAINVAKEKGKDTKYTDIVVSDIDGFLIQQYYKHFSSAQQIVQKRKNSNGFGYNFEQCLYIDNNNTFKQVGHWFLNDKLRFKYFEDDTVKKKPIGGIRN